MQQPDILPVLQLRRTTLLEQLEELQQELVALDVLIARYQSTMPRGRLKVMLPLRTKQPRVRGVLAAARKAIDQFSGPFNKNELLAKLIEMDNELGHKQITGSNIRNALRLLTQNGVIKIVDPATPTSCAKYIKAA